MTQKTPLFDLHVQAGGKIVDFGGWQLPVHYGSLVDEHHAVRDAAGVFDVSHMTIVDISGADATAFLQRLLCNDVQQLETQGAALYTCMLNEQGGVIDDLIVYFFDRDDYRLVVNAGTREKDLAWINAQASSYSVDIVERPELAMLAVQGPNAASMVNRLLPAKVAEAAARLDRFSSIRDGDLFIAATGYTGEEGYEIALASAAATELWENLLQAGVTPCGLGARDTLRLEAGMNLYGTDMDEADTPLTSGLAWTVAWQPADRNFIGRAALEQQRSDGIPYKLVGFVLDGKGVLRSGQTLFCSGAEVGKITSGTYSPTLKESVAFGRIKSGCSGEFEVQIRRNRLPVRQVSRVFVRNGKSTL